MAERFVALCAPGLEDLLVDEVRGFGAKAVSTRGNAVTFRGTLRVGYQACLWSRVASRVLLTISRGPARSPDELYDTTRTVLWREHIDPRGTFAVSCALRRARLDDARFATMRVKDAIVDQFRDATGHRPDVDRDTPAVTVHVHLERDDATYAIDLSGDALHRRGYRDRAGDAPLKETLAAAILLRSGWPEISGRGGILLDPMCGAGTLCIEGALIAGDIAPGLLRERFGFDRWPGHAQSVWTAVHEEAIERRAKGRERIPEIRGSDIDDASVAQSRDNAKRAGLPGAVQFNRGDVRRFQPRAHDVAGLVATNPPYGVRLSGGDELGVLYRDFGRRLREHFDGWSAAVLGFDVGLMKNLGLTPKRVNRLRNGALDCRLYRYEIGPTPAASRAAPTR